MLEWLENHTFPEELRFGDQDYASQVAVEFLDELLRNGTTSALAYPTVHADSPLLPDECILSIENAMPCLRVSRVSDLPQDS